MCGAPVRRPSVCIYICVCIYNIFFVSQTFVVSASGLGAPVREASSSLADRQPAPQHLSERREREREREDATNIYISI